jgi:hypothetical protein
MNKLKTMAAASALLFGAAQVMAQHTGNGTFSVEVPSVLNVNCTQGVPASLSNIVVANNSNQSSFLSAPTVVCAVNSNQLKWDMKVSGDAHFKLEDASTVFLSAGTQDKLSYWIAPDKDIGMADNTGAALAQDASTDLSAVSIGNIFNPGVGYFSERGTFEFTISAGLKSSNPVNTAANAEGAYKAEITVVVESVP